MTAPPAQSIALEFGSLEFGSEDFVSAKSGAGASGAPSDPVKSGLIARLWDDFMGASEAAVAVAYHAPWDR